MRYVYDYEMTSPLASPYSDGHLNYSHGTTPVFEKKLVIHYIITNSLQLLVESYPDKLELSHEEMSGLVQFTVHLFKRTQLTLQQFQRLLIVLNRYINKCDVVQLSCKQIILGLLVEILGTDTLNWPQITGMSAETIHRLMDFLDDDLEEKDYEVAAEELDMINDKMKTLIYSRFDVI